MRLPRRPPHAPRAVPRRRGVRPAVQRRPVRLHRPARAPHRSATCGRRRRVPPRRRRRRRRLVEQAVRLSLRPVSPPSSAGRASSTARSTRCSTAGSGPTWPSPSPASPPSSSASRSSPPRSSSSAWSASAWKRSPSPAPSAASASSSRSSRASAGCSATARKSRSTRTRSASATASGQAGHEGPGRWRRGRRPVGGRYQPADRREPAGRQDRGDEVLAGSVNQLGRADGRGPPGRASRRSPAGSSS